MIPARSRRPISIGPWPRTGNVETKASSNLGGNMNRTRETLRAELTKLPDRIAALPVFRGYPVPWFVAYPNGPEGEPEFRTFDPKKWIAAVQEKRCWVCGQQLGAYLAFVLGPMCGITRTTSEPP